MEEYLIQGTESWKEWRKSMVMASDASVIDGTNPYKTPLKLWSQKLNIDADDELNERMSEGQRLEPIARELFIKEMGIYVEPKVCIHSEYQWMGASVDGTNELGQTVEIKCSKKIYEDLSNGIIKPYYVSQMQHQMAVLNIKEIYFFAYWDNKFSVQKIHRDDEYIKELIKKEKEFFKCLVTFTPPPMCDRDYSQGSKEWIQTAKGLKTIKETMKSLAEQEERLTEILISLSDSRNTNGDGIKFTRSYRKGNIQYSNIPELLGVDLDKYRKEGSHFWRLSSIKEE